MDREEDIDNELKILKKRRDLLTKMKVIKEQRIRAKIDNPQAPSSWKDLINNNTPPENESDEVAEADLKLLKEFLKIESHDFEKNDNNKYSARITMDYITLAVEFSAENTSTGDNNTREISNLSVKVSDIDDCYANELQSCIDYCEENNDLQLLMCSIPKYQQKHDDRVNMIQKLASLEGLSLKHSKHDETKFYICSDKKPRTVYCKVNWTLQFSLRSLCFFHWFDFEDGDEDGFVRSNKKLLKTFNNYEDKVLLKTKWMELYKVITNTNESEISE